ncbi:amino acid/polyamine/organocation transporter, APC superfamily [Singulisphaera sp. GP187]|uniref:amino acid permease n=1 Tax=Singulisphaera sp. GP187 TaxID=1882752 RepID=UPI00092716BB|nr:amino acid permease [Singulisphaera sp. GP187]SIN96441.1 amino acid/polyamine/organocation transporter, APC superfamily [Singulisphaera sp. GP187]
MANRDLGRDSSDLAAFGYRQRLDRTLGSFSSFAAGFSYLSILTGLPQLFYLGYGAGGPAFFWTWPLVFVGQFFVALCFAELAARYPLAGGVYQWSRQIGPAWVGWMAGWVYLACAVITLASVALALQATLPQISPWFQIVGRIDSPADAARNAVLLGCVLIAFSMLINAVGVRLLARINNVGVFAEMVGTLLLIILLTSKARRGIGVVFDTQGRGGTGPFSYLGPFFAAALIPSFVMYGFDTAGSLAEETNDPRRRAPRAILGALAAVGGAGALLILGVLRGVENLADPQLGQISGGMQHAIKQILGPFLGMLLLCVVALAILICTLTVHAAAVRLVFSMARDNNLPFSHALAWVSGTSRTPVLPAILLGLFAALILGVNVNFPQVIEVLVSVSIVWANLAYLLVTIPMLCSRLRRGATETRPLEPGIFRLGRWGLFVNFVAVVWGVLVVINIGWPRQEIYGTIWYRRYSAPIATALLLIVGALFYRQIRRGEDRVLEAHRAPENDHKHKREPHESTGRRTIG